VPEGDGPEVLADALQHGAEDEDVVEDGQEDQDLVEDAVQAAAHQHRHGQAVA